MTYVYAVLCRDADPYVPPYLERIYKRLKDAKAYVAAQYYPGDYSIRKMKVR